MLGLFGDEDVAYLKATPIRASVPKVYSCDACSLKTKCTTPMFPAYGKGERRIMLVLDKPSQAEDTSGHPWSGAEGSLFRQEIERQTGINFFRDCWTVYGQRCHSSKATAVTIASCRKLLHDDIEQLNPTVIIPLGYWAVQALLGDILTGKDTGSSSTDWAGEVIPDQRWKKWILPTFEYTYIGLTGRSPQKPVLNYMIDTFKKALSYIDKPVPIRQDDLHVHTTEDALQARKWLMMLYESQHPYIAFDYETSGLKPHRKEQFIYTVSICDGHDSYAMPFFAEDRHFMVLYKRLMTSPRIQPIAHNAAYEDSWTRVKCGFWPSSLVDTILGAHIEHNLKPTGLKPLTYKKFGVAGYESDVSPYLCVRNKQDEQLNGDNAINDIKHAPLDRVLYYNALDSLYTYELFVYFNDTLSSLQKNAWYLQNTWRSALDRATYNGMRIDMDLLQKQKVSITAKIDGLYQDIQAMSSQYGWDKSTPFRPSASEDMRYFVYTILKTPVTETTKSGGATTDKDFVSRLNHPLLNAVLEWKRLIKLRDTYIHGLEVEGVDGFVHPNFLLHSVKTYRSSSSSINFQNFPKRDKESYAAIRGCLLPHKGQYLAEFDYKSLEVMMNAAYNKDPNLISYLKDSSSDMHRDSGENCFLYEKGQLPKSDRSVAKSMFVFPEFYGSFYKNVSEDLWNHCSDATKQHLKDKGVTTLAQYTEIIKNAEYILWHERFPVYAKWRDDTWQSYNDTGEVWSYLGFRYQGPMTRNECTNLQAQGAGCHCLLWVLTHMQYEIDKRGLKTRIMGQIHDSCVFSVEPSEDELINTLYYHYAVEALPKVYTWINTPLAVEKAITPAIDMPWCECHEIGYVNSAECPVFPDRYAPFIL